ncbi:MAG: hypothetical protein JSS07_08630 [Proteobacteria bacterium]|nr:hypothetical protein [Pseudomonadota bacterium]
MKRGAESKLELELELEHHYKKHKKNPTENAQIARALQGLINSTNPQIDNLKALIASGADLKAPSCIYKEYEDLEESVEMTPFRYAITLNKIKIAQMIFNTDNMLDDISNEYNGALRGTIDKNKSHKNYFAFLDTLPIGAWPKELIDSFLHRTSDYLIPSEYTNHYLLLRIKCEQYVKATSTESKAGLLIEIENQLIDYQKHSFPNSGAKLPFPGLFQGCLLKNVYLFQNEELILLFAKYLPVPKAEYFQDVPKYIKAREASYNELVTNFIAKNKEYHFEQLENKILTIQRKFRSIKRQKEEQHRIPEIFPELFPPKNNEISVENFGKPYVPQKCSSALANRIVNAASKIKFLRNIRHLTNEDAIKSIFNDCLYGRVNLMLSFIPFNPASLHSTDIENGDANVICCGADYGKIDSRTQNIELTFDLNKMNLGATHCAFFKQQDLEFGDNSIRAVKLDMHNTLFFKHTGSNLLEFRKRKYKYMHLTLKDQKNFDYIGEVANYELISYDIENINSVLILNFFRYLDNLIPLKNDDTTDVTAKVYQAIKAMTDEELDDFLKNIGLNFSDTMEFNYYGGHQIDFNSLVNIKKMRFGGDSLNIPDFIAQLQAGQLEKLKKAKQIFPFIFQSYRFLDFLSSKIDNALILNELAILYANCKKPEWHPSNPKLTKMQEPVMLRTQKA